MAAEGQTVALDMLFAPVEHWGVSSRLWEVIVNNREKLLTSRTAAFSAIAVVKSTSMHQRLARQSC